MWWTAVAPGGIGMPGFTRRVFTIGSGAVPSGPGGKTFISETSTIRSLRGSTPVVSRSR
jgi:hypothetical protein